MMRQLPSYMHSIPISFCDKLSGLLIQCLGIDLLCIDETVYLFAKNPSYLEATVLIGPSQFL